MIFLSVFLALTTIYYTVFRFISYVEFKVIFRIFLDFTLIFTKADEIFCGMENLYLLCVKFKVELINF